MQTTTKRPTRDHLAKAHGYAPGLFADAPLTGMVFEMLPDEMLDNFHDYLHGQACWANTDGHVHENYPDDEDDGPDYEGVGI